MVQVLLAISTPMSASSELLAKHLTQCWQSSSRSGRSDYSKWIGGRTGHFGLVLGRDRRKQCRILGQVLVDQTMMTRSKNVLLTVKAWNARQSRPCQVCFKSTVHSSRAPVRVARSTSLKAISRVGHSSKTPSSPSLSVLRAYSRQLMHVRLDHSPQICALEEANASTGRQSSTTPVITSTRLHHSRSTRNAAHTCTLLPALWRR